jgi:hypothetical protein
MSSPRAACVTICIIRFRNHFIHHWKNPCLPGIRRTKAGLDFSCRPYKGYCRTRTGDCRPGLHGPAGTCAAVVRHGPVLGYSSRLGGRQDRVLDRHILRHCYMCRSQAGTTGLDLKLPDLCRTRKCLGRRLRHRAAEAPYAQVPAPNRTLCDVGRHYAATHRHLNIWVRQCAATGRHICCMVHGALQVNGARNTS